MNFSNNLEDEIIFLCLGDSLTAGSPGFSGFPAYKGNPQSQYEYWLEKLIEKDYKHREIEIVNFGQGGNTVWQIYQRYRRQILPVFTNIDYVIVWIGINDLVGVAAPSDDVIMNIEEMYEFILSNNTGVVAVEIAPITLTSLYLRRVNEVNKGIHKIANDLNLPVVPLYDALLNSQGDGLNEMYDIGDGVHFNVKGYKKIGEVLYNSVLNQILETI